MSRVAPNQRKKREAAARALRCDKTAVFRIDSACVDVTDLLFLDFEIMRRLSNANATLVCQAASQDPGKVLELATTWLDVFDALDARVAQIRARLLCRSARERRLATNETCTSEKIRDECRRINRLSTLATEADYASLGARRRDKIERMSIAELRHRIEPARWVELRVRLRATGADSVGAIRTAARWLVRGLEVEHAVIRAIMNNRQVDFEHLPWDAF